MAIGVWVGVGAAAVVGSVLVAIVLGRSRRKDAPEAPPDAEVVLHPAREVDESDRRLTRTDPRTRTAGFDEVLPRSDPPGGR